MGNAIAKGDRIAWTVMASCGQCVFCEKYSLPQKCTSLFKYGHSRANGPPHFEGTFADYVYLRPGTAVFKLPLELTDEVASPLMCAAATIAGGLDRANVNPGDTVVIQGAGMLGLYASAFVKELGAARVFVIDIQEQTSIDGQAIRSRCSVECK